MSIKGAVNSTEERLNWVWLRVQGLEKSGKNRLDGEWAS